MIKKLLKSKRGNEFVSILIVIAIVGVAGFGIMNGLKGSMSTAQSSVSTNVIEKVAPSAQQIK